MSNNAINSGFSTNAINNFSNRIQNNAFLPPINRQKNFEKNNFLSSGVSNNAALNNGLRIGSSINSQNPVLTSPLRNNDGAFIGGQPIFNSVNTVRPSNTFDLLSLANNLQNNKNDGLTTLESRFLKIY